MKFKIFIFFIISCIGLYAKVYCQIDKFLIHELKVGLYYVSDTSNQKEIFFLNDKLKKINHEKITDGTIFYKDYANVRIGNKYGFIDKKGNIKLFPNYSTVIWTDNLLGLAVKNGKIGYIDRQGKVKIPFKYDMATFFYNHFAVVRDSLTYSLLNENGHSILSSEMMIFPPNSNSLIPFFSDSGQGMMEKDKRIVIEPDYRNLIASENGFIKAINRNNDYGILDVKGKIVVPFNYKEIKVPSSGELIPAKKNGKWGYLNIRNETVINFIYDEAYLFSEGVAAVAVQKKIGFIDKKGKFVIEPQYDFSWNFGSNYCFNGGVSPFFNNGKWGFINKSGKVLIPASYEYVTGFINEKAIVAQNKKFGIINKSGNILLPIINDKIQRSENGIFKVVNGNDKSPDDNSLENIEDILLYQALIYLYKK